MLQASMNCYSVHHHRHPPHPPPPPPPHPPHRILLSDK